MPRRFLRRTAQPGAEGAPVGQALAEGASAASDPLPVAGATVPRPPAQPALPAPPAGGGGGDGGDRHAASVAGLWADPLGRVATRSAQVLLLVGLIVAAVYALVQLRILVVPVLISLLLAAAIGPLVNLMRQRNVPSALATWIALLSALLLFGGVVTGVVFAVRTQWGSLVDSASAGLQRLQEYLASGPLPIDDQQIEDARAAAVDWLTSSAFASGALSGAVRVGEVVAGALLAFVVLFYLLKDGGRIWGFLVQRLGGSHRGAMNRSGARALEVLGGYVRGTAIIAAVDAIVIGATLLFLGVPLALPLAVIVFVAAFVPLVGATVSGILAALVALVANGPVAALVVVIVVIAVNQLEGDLLAPYVLGKSLDLHPLVILSALTAGTILGGIVGAILSVPIAAVTWAVIKTWRGEESAQGTVGKPD